MFFSGRKASVFRQGWQSRIQSFNRSLHQGQEGGEVRAFWCLKVLFLFFLENHLLTDLRNCCSLFSPDQRLSSCWITSFSRTLALLLSCATETLSWSRGNTWWRSGWGSPTQRNKEIRSRYYESLSHFLLYPVSCSVERSFEERKSYAKISCLMSRDVLKEATFSLLKSAVSGVSFETSNFPTLDKYTQRLVQRTLVQRIRLD